MRRQALIDAVMMSGKCSDRPARDAIDLALDDGVIVTFTELNPRGGKPLRWYCLPEHKIQWVK